MNQEISNDLIQIGTEEMTADDLTKGLLSIKHAKFLSQLGVTALKEWPQ